MRTNKWGGGVKRATSKAFGASESRTGQWLRDVAELTIVRM